jgi:hypothetical protein
MPDYIQTSDIRERDIDLLLLEELTASQQFQQHFLTLLDGAIPAGSIFLSAQHSVSNSLGQSDLTVDFRAPSGEICRVFVENKIDAGFQPNQPSRYVQRGCLDRDHGHCHHYATALVAPSRYLVGADKVFDRAVSYENIRAWFEGAAELGGRRRCKLGLLDAAIQKAEATNAKDERVTDFWRAYWAIVQQVAPELRMPEPGGRSGGFVHFYPASLPLGVDFVHKMNHGHLDVQFPGMGHRLKELESAFSGRLLATM